MARGEATDERAAFENAREFSKSVSGHPDWAVVVAARAALRVLPVLAEGHDSIDSRMPLAAFRAVSISRFVSLFPVPDSKAIAASASAAKSASALLLYAVSNAANTAYAAHTGGDYVGYAARTAEGYASDFFDFAKLAISSDVQSLQSKKVSAQRLARSSLWPRLELSLPVKITRASQQLSAKLLPLGEHWKVWIDWYEKVLVGWSASHDSEWEAVFTDVRGPLPWSEGAEAVNILIRARLEELHQEPVIRSKINARIDEEIDTVTERIERYPTAIRLLAEKLSGRLDGEIERLKRNIPNDDADHHWEYVKFLSSITKDLKEIVGTLDAVLSETDIDRKKAEYERASNIVGKLAQKVTQYVEQNADRLVDYSVKTAFLGVGCAFLTTCGAPPVMAFPVLAGLLGGKELLDYVKTVRQK